MKLHFKGNSPWKLGCRVYDTSSTRLFDPDNW